MPVLARFLSVGVVNTVLGLAVIVAGLRLGLNDYAANAIGYAVGFACSYLLNRSYTFGATGTPHSAQLPRFAVAVAVSYGLNLAVIRAGHLLGFDGRIVLQLAAITVYTACFYVLSRLFVFRRERETADRRAS